MNSRGLWIALGLELGKRLKEPLQQPPFVFYFLLALTLGALGVWAALAEGLIAHWEEDTPKLFFRALWTFFPAIGSLACIQVIIVEDDQKSLRALFSLLLVAFLLLAIISRTVYPHNATLAFAVTGIGTVLAVLIWWLANGDHDSFKDTTDPEDPMGGSVEKELAGDTHGFVT